MPLFVALVFTPLTSSPLSLPSFYLSTSTQGWHWGKGEAGRTEEHRWTGVRTKGIEERRFPYASPLSWLCSCTIQKQPAQIRLVGGGIRPTYCPSGSRLLGRARGHCICSVLVFPTAWPLFTISCSLLCIHGTTPAPGCQTAEELWLLCAPCIHCGRKRQLSPPLAFSKSYYSWKCNNGKMAPASNNAKFWNKNNLDEFQNDAETLTRAHSGHIFDLGSISRRHYRWASQLISVSSPVTLFKIQTNLMKFQLNEYQ